MTADREKRRLKNESQPDREKIKASRLKIFRAQQDGCACDRRQKADCRNDENMSIHGAATLKSRLPLGNAALRQSEFSLSSETGASYKSAVNGSTPSLGVLAGSNSYF